MKVLSGIGKDQSATKECRKNQAKHKNFPVRVTVHKICNKGKRHANRKGAKQNTDNIKDGTHTHDLHSRLRVMSLQAVLGDQPIKKAGEYAHKIEI